MMDSQFDVVAAVYFLFSSTIVMYSIFRVEVRYMPADSECWCQLARWHSIAITNNDTS
jgi:hypothetical protein